ncbi:MAG: AraC family transcriptional regulator ligand-binding domain-containing protein [Myxococcota bacterium]
MSFLPAASVLAVLEGLRALGVDVARIRRDVRLSDDVNDPETLVPATLFADVLCAARQQVPRDELVLEVGLSVPLGAFGVMDYLAASCDTVGEAFTALSRLFPSVAPGCAIRLDANATEYCVSLVNENDYEKKVSGDELTLGIVLRHFRAFSESFPLVSVDFTRHQPSSSDGFRKLLGVPVRFAEPCAALHLAPDAPKAILKSRDPLLRRTLESMASRLGLGAPAPPLEMVIRGRLRELLPEGNADAAHVAGSLALSTRSLHRKLAELGRSFHDVLSDFRRAEAERLLAQGGTTLTDVALRLGFADQSAFSRAFKRWTDLSPSQWRSAHSRKNNTSRTRTEEPT